MPNRMSEYFFNLAKRSRKKAKNIHIEKENLSTKANFYSNMYHAIEQAKTTQELELLVPKRAKAQRKKEKLKECELFWIDDYKVLIGRNSKENQALLKIAKSNDIWMHIRNIPSSHLIIKTDKQNLPDSVIEKASKLCVDFSLNQAGDYDVDYCKRRFVKIQEGSNVEYDKYKTIRVRKEGIEIRE
jgi:predicted ribosome quality control (RQC) complex YloA/Tae2 family protein